MARRWCREALLISALLLCASAASAAERVTADHGVAAGGDIQGSTITIGLTPKEVRELVDRILSEAGVDAAAIIDLSTKLGVTQGAVATFLRILGEADVPVEELPAKLAEIAERHKALLAQIEAVRSESPGVQAITDQARSAAEDGDYDRAEELLAEAEEAALASADQLLLDAAALRAERGELAWTRLDYRGAAEHFAAAAGLVPPSNPLVRADYLNRQGQAAYHAGAYTLAQPAFEEALQLREARLEPDDPALSATLNNLAALYHATGRYAEAEPLYQRAIAIDEGTLGPNHPDLARDLNNLAELYRETGHYAEAEPLYQRS